MAKTNLGQLVSRELLPRVQKPGQYIGLEPNARCKDVDEAEVAVTLAFPDTYGIGVSHLGSQVLYQMLNDIDGASCDRTYCPQSDAEAVMRNQNIQLFSWESRRAVRDFDILGFSLAYELCVTNVLTILDLAGIPLHTNQRSQADPIVIAGDALADTPEPMADFIDLFIVGDGEKPTGQLVELVKEMKRCGAKRDEIILEATRKIPSVYAPAYYEASYNSDGTLKSLSPTQPDLPEVVEHAFLEKLSDSPGITAPLVPLSEAVHERVVIEIMRGCPNGCRFCQAGHARLPVRWRSVDEIVDVARKAIAATGYSEISLLSLSTSDYPKLNELIDRLNAEFADKKISISLPSLRVDSQLRQLPKLTSKVRKGGLTIAAEAALPRMREAIRKNITDENMIAGVKAAYEAGWQKVKVYFMAGLPGETPEDIDGIFDLCKRLSDSRREVDGQRGAISASVSWMVPKPHTPMQFCAMRKSDYFFEVRHRLKDLSRRSPVNFRFHWIERSFLEVVLARGDRRVGKAIEAAWQNGARMDSWDECFDFEKWTTAFAQAGIDPDFYAHREIQPDELTPWSHIRCFRGEEFLKDEYARMNEILAE